MLFDQRSPLSCYVSGLLSTGQTDFTAREAERALGIGHGAFLDAAERLQRRKALLSPRQGFYVRCAAAIRILGGATTGMVHRFDDASRGAGPTMSGFSRLRNCMARRIRP